MDQRKQAERRRHRRFTATAFLKRAVLIRPLQGFHARPSKGTLIDLSAGGLAVLMNEPIPVGTGVHLRLLLTDRTPIECDATMVHSVPRGGRWLHGFQFLNLDTAAAGKIDQMSGDYIDCEHRIQNQETPVCRQGCAFLSMCDKAQRLPERLGVQSPMELFVDRLPANYPTDSRNR